MSNRYSYEWRRNKSLFFLFVFLFLCAGAYFGYKGLVAHRTLQAATAFCGDFICEEDEECNFDCSTETYCSDETDNDEDGDTDCDDSDCSGDAACTCTVTEGPPEATCNDGLDNDCNQGADCADPDCDGDTCQSGGVCVSNKCCGDGTVDTPTEQCDDGNTNNSDGCSNTCQHEAPCDNDSNCEAGENCTTCAQDCTCPTDDCDSNCRLTWCGDGTIQDPNGAGFSEECEKTSECGANEFCSGCLCVDEDVCGNSVTEGTEECDDGKRCTDNGDPCQSNLDCNGGTCVGKSGDGCTTPGGGGAPVCGNWLVEAPEQCDDGNTDNGDGCSSICELPGSCGSCPDCPTAAENWSLTVAGIVDIPGDPSPCTGGCNKYNGVFSLPYAQLENISECNGSCLWCWGDSGNSGCDALNPIWTLYYDSLNSKYVLNTGADGTPWYSISEASWNCNGANTLTKEAGPVTNCQTWPETIQVTPQGVRECTP